MKLRFDIVNNDSGKVLKSVTVDSLDLPGGINQIEAIAMKFGNDIMEYVVAAKIAKAEDITIEESLEKFNGMLDLMMKDEKAMQYVKEHTLLKEHRKSNFN